MKKNFVESAVVRQNVLNNTIAMDTLQQTLSLDGVMFESKLTFIKRQVAEFFEVTERTIDYCIEKNEKEIAKNGYEVLRGKRLVDYKLAFQKHFGNETDFVTKTTVLGIFDFRAFLNVAMLLTDSEKARSLRSAILDVVIDTINKRTGGSTKYINQRDEDFVSNIFRGEVYRKEFTDALRDCVAMGNIKYMIYTDKVYNSIFKENSTEYRKILNLEKSENMRDTMYSEVLDIIASYEAGFAETLRSEMEEKGRKLSSHETDILFSKFENQRLWAPLREKARNKMASRDLCFRDALHKNLEEYISAVPQSDFERFLGEKSMELDKRLEEYKDALKRLKERD
ncbi:DNA-binding protein [Bacteroides sp. ET71]|uniref:DNA-binding protein n=1 Tax=Bacteroides sp. ET71 TaxID=2939421 RepID=UPI002013BB07|nr:DNA-binding protein [Bacteroides sp. ET71]MCL1617610.1 DNA-binding protein [Bacteroides sp. ET71]